MPKKNFNLSENQLEKVNQFIAHYQQSNSLANQGEALYNLILEYEDLIRKGIIEPEVMTPDEKKMFDEILNFCDRGLMQLISGVPVCGKRSKLGLGQVEYFIYPNNHPDKDLRGQLMTYEDIIKNCELYKQSFTEDPRIKDLMDRMSIVLDKGQLIKLYFCNHPQLEQTIFTAFRDCTIHCCKVNRNVNLDRTCLLRGCEFLEIMEIKAPPPKPIEA